MMDIKKKNLESKLLWEKRMCFFLKKTFILRLTVQFMQKYLVCRELCQLNKTKQNKTAHPKAEN